MRPLKILILLLYLILQASLPIILSRADLNLIALLKLIFYPILWASMNIIYEQYHIAKNNKIELADYILFNSVILLSLFLMEAPTIITELTIELGLSHPIPMPRLNYTIP